MMLAQYPEPDTLQVIQFLRSIPINVSQRCNLISHFRRLTDDSAYGAHFNTIVPQLLDAFAYFIRAEPRSGKAYALSLSLDAGRVIVSLAGTNIAECTPLTILETIWDYMVRLSTSWSTDVGKDVYDDFITYALDLTLASHRYRFNEGRKEYEEIWQAYATRGTKNYSAPRYMEKAHPIYTTTQEFYDGVGSKNIADVDQDTLREYLDSMLVQCQALKDQTRKIGCGGDEWRDLGPSTIRKELGLNMDQLDVVDYINNVAGPFLHLKTLYDISTSPRCHDYLRLRFRIQIVTDPELYTIQRSSIPVFWNDKASVERFLSETMLVGGMQLPRDFFPGDVMHGTPSIADDVIRNLPEGEEHVTPFPARPHCGCLLVQYHHQDLGMKTHWYFALSEPCCLQCNVFLHAYNNESFMKAKFFSKRGCYVAPPFRTPALDIRIDPHIMEQMKRKFYWMAQFIVYEREKKLNPKAFRYEFC